jgi:NAD(P)-dependent dehydrogenase (short-subunit alcohol dehydrogenase family)
MTTQSLHGTHALVTGANRGIGLAVVTALVNDGARVSMLVRDADAGQRAADTFGDAVTVVIADVTSETEVQAACAQGSRHFGPVHVLVNNAGFTESAPVLRSDRAMFERLMQVHLYAAVSTTQAVLPAMLEARFGRIINIASTAGVAGHAYVSAYAAAKHALVGFTRSVAKEVIARGVTVNAVCPGYTDTDLVTESVSRIVGKTGRSAEETRAALLASNPLGRLVTPAEVAGAVRWLCDANAASVTGQTIIIDGGELS